MSDGLIASTNGQGRMALRLGSRSIGYPDAALVARADVSDIGSSGIVCWARGARGECPCAETGFSGAYLAQRRDDARPLFKARQFLRFVG